MSSGPDVQKSTGMGPVSTGGGGGGAALTLAGVLSSHTSTPNPPMAALEQVISERNVLSSQNSQLWKLVEKQRSGYSQILKELERVRSERDTFKARLASLGENPDHILKKQKASKGSRSGNTLKPSSSHSGLRSDDQHKATPEDPRQAMTRHQSEDSVPRDRLTPSPRDSVRPTAAVRADSLGPSPAPPTLHLNVNTQPYSGPQSSASAPALSPASSLVSSPPMSTQSFVTVTPSPFTPTPPNPSLNIPPPSSGDLLQPIPLANLPPQNGDPPRHPALSRESRISLPEEAKRYMATIGESPAPSPIVFSFASKSAEVRSESPSQVSVSETKVDQTQADSTEGEFLDLDDSANDEDGTDSETSLSDGELEEDKPSSRSVEDFPMPPTSHPPVAPSVYSQSSVPDQESVHSGYTASTKVDPTASTTSFQSSNPPNNPQPKPRHRPMPSLDSPISVQPHFRQLPLLVSDFPTTRVQVSHSSIRPNDRGKEVLSFVISVDPGSGKESWKIEKLYSDFISLDQKIRSVNRNIAKKMPSLPDSKLWRDHAPAKVDQRKVALENYLQNILSLPIKDRNEIAAFFTSDIVRARQPVASAGYKEGYLTKRGKNFGGWKRRYFVLQGSVLEYYESRGGAHLGSITITGAQIGRQQRAGTSQSVDEDNEYRHAFLIIEVKKGQSTSASPRHVLCAESDPDRDSWVEVLVRHVNGGYYDDQQTLPSSSSSTHSNGLSPIVTSVALGNGNEPAQPRSSTSSVGYSEQTLIPNKSRGYSRDDPGRLAHGALQEDGNSPLEGPVSSSLPSSSPLDGDGYTLAAPRSHSSLGLDDSGSDVKGTPSRPRHLPTNNPTSSPEYHRSKDRDKRRSVQPLKVSSGIPKASLDGRSTSPDIHTPRIDQNGKVKISGPIGGAPIPAGYKFGASGKDKEKDAPEQSTPGSDRREKAKSKMFWGFGRPNEKNAVPAQAQPPRAVFGTTLEESLEVAQIANLPAIIFRCIQYLEVKKADQEEGIYRLSGSSAVIKSLKDRFNSEGDVDLLGSDEYWDPHAIAGLLKTFMRELPASILTRELHTRFLSVIDFVDAQERIKELSSLISQLPLANYSLLRALTAHLILIVQNSNVNKMTMRNVGIVFSPTLGIPAGVFSLMLGEFNRVFNVEESEAHGEELEDSPVRRNSRHYSDAAADELLGLAGRSLKAPSDDSDDEDDSPVQEDNGANLADDSHDAEASAVPNLRHTRASTIAASRGLNVSVSSAKDEPRLLRPGLPVSPRPLNSPRYSPSPTASPMTPR